MRAQGLAFEGASSIGGGVQEAEADADHDVLRCGGGMRVLGSSSPIMFITDSSLGGTTQRHLFTSPSVPVCSMRS